MCRRTRRETLLSTAPREARGLARVPRRPNVFSFAPLLTCFALLAAGCGHPAPPATPVRVEPRVRLVKAELRDLARSVGQPGFISAFEETSIYPKVPGYVKEWNVDIGDRITKGKVIARLAVPELEAEHQEKVEQIALNEAQVAIAQELVGQREAEEKQAVETREYRNVRYERFVKAAKGKGIEQSLVDEEYRDFQAARFGVDAAQAAVRKARVDVKAAQAQAKVTAGLTAAGIGCGVFAIVALVAGQVAALEKAWARIMVRVAGSWIGAIGLLMLGWAAR